MKTPFALLTLATFLVSACREREKQAEARAAPAPSAKVTVLEPAYPVSDTFKAALGQVLDGYGRIHQALSKDDLEGAQAATASLRAALAAVPKESLESAARAHWDSTETRIAALLEPLAAADSLGAARKPFMDISLALLDAIGKFGVSGKEPVYHFHCPMARENKGADWVQKDSLLANPYYGSSMLKCGELVKILKG